MIWETNFGIIIAIWTLFLDMVIKLLLGELIKCVHEKLFDPISDFL